jgi:hypothetical protein
VAGILNKYSRVINFVNIMMRWRVAETNGRPFSALRDSLACPM